MLKHVVLLSIAMFCSVQSQRPWHAGSSSNRLPQVLPQYIDERIAAEQAVQAAQAGTGIQGQTGIANQGQPGVAIQGQPGVAIQGQPGVAIQGQPGVAIQGQPGVASQGQPGVAIQGQPGFASQGQPGVAIQGQAGPINQSGQGTQTASGTDLLGNRIGGGTIASAAAAPTPSTIIPSDLPVDAHGDIELINRIKTWPRDKQPFWYINWQAIQAHRGDVNNSAQPVETQPNPMSFFAG